MNLEQRIKKQEEELARLKAISSVKFSFPNDTPKSIKDELTKKLKELCTSLAKSEEPSIDKSVGQPQLSSDEVSIVKSFIERLNSKGAVPKTPTAPRRPETLKEIVQAGQQAQDQQPLTARLLTLDGIPDSKQRQKIDPEAVVKIVNMKEDQAVCLFEVKNSKNQTTARHRFVVPVEDLDFHYKEGEN